VCQPPPLYCCSIIINCFVVTFLITVLG
jgi:hypothetical protein